MDDKTAELLEQIEKDFMHRANVDAALTQFWKKAGQRQATQDDAADYATRLGEVLSATLQDHIVPAGDAGKIEERLQQLNVKSMVSHARQIAGVPEEEETEFYQTVQGTVDPMMKRAHTMINRTAAQVQKAIDEANGIGLNSVKAAYPQKRIHDLIVIIAAPENSAEDVRKHLGEPVVTNCEKFFDEHVQANAAARFDLGMEPVIVRTAAPGCCAWCAKLAGVYPYDEVRYSGNDVFRRHQYCRCHVIFECDGERQDVWSKKIWAADEETLEQRAAYGLETQKATPEEMQAEYERREAEKALAKEEKRGIIKTGGISGGLSPDDDAAQQHAELYYAEIRKRSSDIAAIANNSGFKKETIKEIKEYVFLQKHDLGGEEPEYFYPSYQMAQSWQRLIEGTSIQKHDITLLQHEGLELRLVNDGFSQEEAHLIASKSFNYAKEAKDYYAEINQHQKRKRSN